MHESAGRDTPGRPYRSPLREQRARRTRERVLAAATAGFLARGYAATTMQEIATAAGVSVPTIEAIFGTKAHLLKTAIDVARAGDDEPVPVLQREWAVEARATATVEAFLAIVGRVLVDASQRAAGLVVAAFEAGCSDPTMRSLADQLASQRAATAAWIVDGITDRDDLRTGIDREQATDTVWLLMDPAVFVRLTRDRGWSPEQFERWFADGVARLLLAPPSSVHTVRRPSDRAPSHPPPKRGVQR